ncbi:hypothetical protein LP52_04090 [Streptomonospora alba]|uniref:Uncharacterized protein n=1 Tax=Streptomonospora alba TaxID=183763 RepID=A0A0C2JFH0_9ACTN|nr:hypothetical protein [Streptomonospora alba]KII00102.1 hypothetical protein LP52_04090 [Streptomonospora alba]
MDYIKGIISLVGAEGAEIPAYSRGVRGEPAGGLPEGYRRLVEELGGFVVDGVVAVMPPESVLLYERSHDPRLAGSERRVTVDDGYAMKLGPRRGDEEIDHDRMQKWAEARVENGWSIFWEYSQPETRIVVTDYFEYFVYPMQPDEFLYKLLTRRLDCRPLIDADWPGERFEAAFL